MIQLTTIHTITPKNPNNDFVWIAKCTDKRIIQEFPENLKSSSWNQIFNNISAISAKFFFLEKSAPTRVFGSSWLFFWKDSLDFIFNNSYMNYDLGFLEWFYRGKLNHVNNDVELVSTKERVPFRKWIAPLWYLDRLHHSIACIAVISRNHFSTILCLSCNTPSYGTQSAA